MVVGAAREKRKIKYGRFADVPGCAPFASFAGRFYTLLAADGEGDEGTCTGDTRRERCVRTAVTCTERLREYAENVAALFAPFRALAFFFRVSLCAVVLLATCSDHAGRRTARNNPLLLTAVSRTSNRV